MSGPNEHDALVIGAGPVGLFAACCLTRRGLDVAVVDRERHGATRSFAVALHPRTLRLLESEGLDRDVVEQGNPIERISYFLGGEQVGSLELGAVGGTHPYVLAIPQSAFEGILERRLGRLGAAVSWNHQVERIVEEPDGVRVAVTRLDPSGSASEDAPMPGAESVAASEIGAAFVLGADGLDSFTRRFLGLDHRTVGIPETFAVFEFHAGLDHPGELRVVFDGGLGNVLWPLHSRQGRWNNQLDPDTEDMRSVDELHALITTRAPWFTSEIDAVTWSSVARFERRCCERFGRDRIWLAGDAAHCTAPCAAQSVNAGLHEAYGFADRAAAIQRGEGSLDTLRDFFAGCVEEWRVMMDTPQRIRRSESAVSWARDLAEKMHDFLPASGRDLDTLLAQLDVR